MHVCILLQHIHNLASMHVYIPGQTSEIALNSLPEHVSVFVCLLVGWLLGTGGCPSGSGCHCNQAIVGIEGWPLVKSFGCSPVWTIPWLSSQGWLKGGRRIDGTVDETVAIFGTAQAKPGNWGTPALSCTANLSRLQVWSPDEWAENRDRIGTEDSRSRCSACFSQDQWLLELETAASSIMHLLALSFSLRS